MQTQVSKMDMDFQPIERHEDEICGQLSSLIQESRLEDALSVVNEYKDSYWMDSSFLKLTAQVYKSLYDYSSENIYLKQLVHIDSQPEHSIQLAENLAQLGDFPAALKRLHDILDNADGKAPILFEVYKHMGNIYLKCGDIDAAEDNYNKANGINNQDENLIVNYGVLAIQKGDYDSAKQRFSDVLTINGNSDLAWVGMALVHRAHGDQDLSRACLLRGLDENPYNKLAIANYYQWCEQDSVDPTDEILQKYLSVHPNDSEMTKLFAGMSH